MRKALFAGMICGYLFTSCQNTGSTESISFDSSIVPTKKAGADQVVPAAVQTPVQTLPVNQPATSTPTPATTVNNATVTAPGMNPPHGQPGHRCDIAVGAPLNSPATKPATVTAPAVTQQAVTKTAPGMNPPHGQPGHRCDIAVGAPLNSAPTKPAVTTSPVVQKPVVASPAADSATKQ